MRRVAFLCLSLLLAACATNKPWRDSSLDSARSPPHEDGPTMRRVMGHEPGVQPLLPEPGNIWADVLPATPQAAPERAATTARPSPPAAASRATDAVPRRAAPVRDADVRGADVRGSDVRGAEAADPAAAPVSRRSAAVQLVAAQSAEGAEAAWKLLQQRLPKLVQGHSPMVTQADVEGHKVWRLRTGGFATRAEADAFCTSVRATKSTCWVVGQ